MLVPAPGVVGDRPRTPDEPRRRLHLPGLDPADLRHALGRILGAKLSIVRKHRAAGQHSLLRRNQGLAFKGEMLDGGAVAARRGVVGDGLFRQSVPGDEMTGVPAFGKIGRAQEPACVRANEMRRVGPHPHERAIIPAAADHHMRQAERERPVGAGANAQPEIGLAGEPDMARIDDNEFHPALERRDRRGRVRQAGVGGVIAPKDQAAAVGDVRHRPSAAAGCDAPNPERVAGGETPAPAAHVQRPHQVRRAEGVHKPAHEGRRIANCGGGGGRLAESHALGPMRLRQPSHRRRRRIQGLVPGDLRPARIRLAFRPGATQGPGQPLLAVDQFRRGPALGAKRLAGRMRGVGIEPREPPAFHAGDAAAAGDAQAAKAGYLRNRVGAHGLLPCLGRRPAPRARSRRRALWRILHRISSRSAESIVVRRRRAGQLLSDAKPFLDVRTRGTTPRSRSSAAKLRVERQLEPEVGTGDPIRQKHAVQ